MYKIIASGILLITSLILTIISLPPYEQGKFVLMSLLVIIAGGTAIGYFISSWTKGFMKEKFKESLKSSFGISCLIYIAGYLFASIQGLI